MYPAPPVTRMSLMLIPGMYPIYAGANGNSSLSHTRGQQPESIERGNIERREPSAAHHLVHAAGDLQVSVQEPRVGEHRGRIDAEHRREPRERAARADK